MRFSHGRTWVNYPFVSVRRERDALPDGPGFVVKRFYDDGKFCGYDYMRTFQTAREACRWAYALSRLEQQDWARRGKYLWLCDAPALAGMGG